MIKKRAAAALLTGALLLVGCTVPPVGGSSAGDLPVAAETCPTPSPERPSFTSGTRQQVLVSAAGVDFWTGLPLPSNWEADHVMPWNEAICSGLNPNLRGAFYSYLPNLAATAGPVNRAKSDWWPGSCDEGAAARPTGACVAGGAVVGWTPPDPAKRCEFLKRYEAAKQRWSLTVDPAEAADLNRERAACA